MDHGPFDNDSQQFIVSHQLLQLLRWLAEYEPDTLRCLIERAMRNGLDEFLVYHNGRQETEEQVQQSVIDFFSVLEACLFDVMQEEGVRKGLQRSLIPAIDHIDKNECDAYVLAQSVDRATNAIKNNPYEDPKEILCKELLKRWKPSKNVAQH